MKNLVLCLFITAISLNLLARESGPSTGGGAYVITCPENPLEPALNVLLDLYEGSHVLRFNMKKASSSIEQDYVDSVRQTYTLQGFPNFKHPTDDELISQLKDFFRSVKIIENPNELPVANDLGETPKIPSQCQIKQLGYFSDEDQVIYILKPLWDKLDS